VTFKRYADAPGGAHVNTENRVSQADQLRAAILDELLATAEALATIDGRTCPTCGEQYGRLYHRACAGCGHHFTTASPDRRHCSDACRQRACRQKAYRLRTKVPD
jgi:hypothetical protein